jgi:hypothetical protein
LTKREVLMLKLTVGEYDTAAEKIADALAACDMRTNLGRALTVLEALGEDFDVSPMDAGPETDLDLAARAFGLTSKTLLPRHWS